jgi:NodT family efflux transporter outer membrane factor (OMF) lipoprotein
MTDHRTIVPRHRSALATLLGAAILLAGCASAPAYRPPSMPDTGYRQAAELPAWKYAEPAELDARGAWWQAFRNEGLNALMDELDQGNQDLRVSEARYRQAVALADAARASLWPRLDLGAAATRGTGGGTGGTSGNQGAANIGGSRRVGLDAAWEVDLWGRLRQQLDAGTLAAEAGAADLAAARLSVQASFAQLYFQARIADAQQGLLDNTVQAYERSLQLTRHRLEFGVATPGDVAQAEAQLNSTQALAVDNRVQRAQLEHALAVLLGRAPAQFTLAAAALPALARAPVVPPGLPSRLLERRPDVAAAERRVAAANAGIGAAQAALFPTLTLGASGGFQSGTAAQWLSLPNRVWALGPALALSLFDGGALRAEVRGAAAAYDATVAGYRQAVLGSVQEVEDALVLLKGLEQESAFLDAAVRASRTSERQVLSRYEAGTVDYLSVVTAQATALAAERSALAAQGRRFAASIALIKALGGGWEERERKG